MNSMAAPPRYPRAATNNDSLFPPVPSPPHTSSPVPCSTPVADCVSSSSSTMLSIPSHPSDISSSTLEDLLRERAAIEPLRHVVPHLWRMLEARIARYSNMGSISRLSGTCTPVAVSYASATVSSSTVSPSPHSVDSVASISPITSRLVRAQSMPLPGMSKRNSLSIPFPSIPRKRVKIPIPADRFPDYNFVGRLLGPRGTTLKTLARDTGCKIMIRGKGSIRKDKEQDVKHKPGYEHVFTEPLHVVIEASESVDDVSAAQALQCAKEAVELLLVPVPEDRDGLKRQQLRALAIMNGTYRGSVSRSCDGLPQFYSVEGDSSSTTSILPSNNNTKDMLQNDACNGSQTQAHSRNFEQLRLCRAVNGCVAEYSSSNDSTLRRHHSHPIEVLNAPQNLMESYSRHGLCPDHESACIQRLRNVDGFSLDCTAITLKTELTRQDIGTIEVPEAINATLEHSTMDDFTSSVDDTPESSPSSEDGSGGGVSTLPGADMFNMRNEDANNSLLSAKGLGLTSDGDIRLGVGVFMGKDFYNGAFSNQLGSETPWDVASSAALSSGAFEMTSPNSPISRRDQAFTITENAPRKSGY